MGNRADERFVLLISLGSMRAPLTTINGIPASKFNTRRTLALSASLYVRAHSSNQTFTVFRLINYSSIVLSRVIYFDAAQASFQRALARNICTYLKKKNKTFQYRYKLLFLSPNSYGFVTFQLQFFVCLCSSENMGTTQQTVFSIGRKFHRVQCARVSAL